jgi:hypothetical protein
MINLHLNVEAWICIKHVKFKSFPPSLSCTSTCDNVFFSTQLGAHQNEIKRRLMRIQHWTIYQSQNVWCVRASHAARHNFCSDRFGSPCPAAPPCVLAVALFFIIFYARHILFLARSTNLEWGRPPPNKTPATSPRGDKRPAAAAAAHIGR